MSAPRVFSSHTDLILGSVFLEDLGQEQITSHRRRYLTLSARIVLFDAIIRLWLSCYYSMASVLLFDRFSCYYSTVFVLLFVLQGMYCILQ